jgi:hypothetical protein
MVKEQIERYENDISICQRALESLRSVVRQEVDSMSTIDRRRFPAQFILQNALRLVDELTEIKSRIAELK